MSSRKTPSTGDAPSQRGLFDPPTAVSVGPAPAADRPPSAASHLNSARTHPIFFIVDASGYIFRAFHALPPLTAADGTPTGATYGFANMLLKVLRELRPEYLAVVWDAEGPSFRDALYAKYKANRKETPAELLPQFAHIRELVAAWNVPSIERAGFEADDVIAALAQSAAAHDIDVVIGSSDKDLMQLVGPRVRMLDTMRDRWFGPNEVREKMGVPPERIIDYLAMVGDSVDNVPGIPGVGPKTALALLAQFGSLDDVLARSGEIEKPRWRSLVEENRESVLLSRDLVTLRCPELTLDLDVLRPRPPNFAALHQILERLGFTRLVRELTPQSALHRENYVCVLTNEQLDACVAEMKSAALVAFDTETTSLSSVAASLVGISLCAGPERAYYIPVAHSYPGAPAQLPMAHVLRQLAPIFSDPTKPKLAQNAKYDQIVLGLAGIEVKGVIEDSMLASYVLNPTRSSHGLNALAQDLLGHTMISFEDVAGKGAHQVTFDKVEIARAAEYSAEDAHATLLCWNVLHDKLSHEDALRGVYERIERPLVSVLANMERNGIRIDVEQLSVLSSDYASKLADLEQRIYAAAGEEFNVASPLQLRDILFKKLRLPVIRKTKSGASTDREVLEELAPQHDVPRLILEHRELAKLKSTYVDALPRLVNPKTGRVHSSWNQTVAATGRLSSSDPNLQNIPIRTHEGRKIRRAFVADPGHHFVAADYSQVELRILAHVSDDPILKDAFAKGEDVHARTALEIFGEVNDDLRRQAKAVNFGIIYGQTAFGLSRQLGIDRSDAAKFIERYLDRYRGVRRYVDETLARAQQVGYVETLFGRRRPTPDINHRNAMVREGARRAAVNTPLQGTAADIMKVAMNRLHDALIARKSAARLVLQIHDELILEVPEEELSALRTLLPETMRSAAELSVELAVDVAVGANWADV